MCDRYAELFNLNPPLEIVRQPYEDKEKEKMRNRFDLALLLKQTPKTYEVVKKDYNFNDLFHLF